ncbi:(2,3-dihydroxybenzoyl)adenylate synthase [Streptomyces sp. NPDC050211]|uniref:(2,3-dihydroxybenzoyl)adenylate synthase n=1 Tax=Streptomyces sp. NPDC050211 TaxID=3154932 RepID=UPI003437AD69
MHPAEPGNPTDLVPPTDPPRPADDEAATLARLRADCPTWPESFAARYRDAGHWRGETFGRMLRERAMQYGDRVAVTGGATSLTYAELDTRADRVAAGLHRLGLRRGDRVVLHLPNVPAFFETLFGLFRLGALPVFALPAHRRAEITHLCRATDARGYVGPDRQGGFDHRDLATELLDEVPSLRHVLIDGEPGPFHALDTLRHGPSTGLPAGPEPHDIAFLQLSGGSTGLPKLIPRTHDDYLYSVRASAEICGLDASSVYLAVLPVSHNFPLSSPGVLGALYAGSRIVLSTDPSPDAALPLIEAEGVTITAVVPPLARIWAQAPARTRHDLSSLRTLQVGGAALGVEAARQVDEAFGHTLQQVFGMAEGLVNYTRLDDPRELVLSTQGRPISPDDEIRIVDDEDRDVPAGTAGHLLTRGPYTIRGYYRAERHNASAFTEDGFYRTGDIVRRTAEGHLVVVGREKDQINRGGEKIASEEVEDHLIAHPGVRDAVVVAIPDAFLGERSCAVIVPSGEPPTTRQLAAFLGERGVAAYKVPDLVRVVTEFPHTAVGKVGKRHIRRVLAAQLREGGPTVSES